jgi:nucleotide-binding universal stress UspA family protein
MTTILSPTRGGEASYLNQDGAIRIAKERDGKLIFLHVSNVQFLHGIASPILIDIETELEHMGEFILVMAQERAEKQGWSAEAIARNGVFMEVLEEVIEEFDVDTVILGSPSEGTGVVTTDYLENIANTLTTEHNVEVLILHDGQVIEDYPPRPPS